MNATRLALGGSPPAARFVTHPATIQNKRATILQPMLPANGR
jgi:hypothetical protein